MTWIFYFICQCFLVNHELPSDLVICGDSATFKDTSDLVLLKGFEELEKVLGAAAEDEVLVVNFWATWCAPCVKELPYFESFHKTYSSKKVRTLLISLDFPKLIEKRVLPAIDKYGLTAELYLLDDPHENEWIDKVDPSWEGTIPATLFIKGDKRYFAEREFHSVDDIKQQIDKL